MIHLKESASGGYRAFWDNGAFIGDIYREVDGYYVWWPIPNGGCCAAYYLRAIADKLDELNKAWDEQVKKECTGPSSEWQTGHRYFSSLKDSCPFDGPYKE